MGMGDDAGVDADDNVLTPAGVSSDDESTESSDINKDETTSVIDKKTNILAKTGAKKKRVQFLPDRFLVRIREIPPRSNKSSSESDGSASDTSDSEGSDSESGSDSEDFSSDRDTPSPAAPTESQNKFTTMPPLMYTAKGSYTISKQNSAKSPNAAIAKITGIDPAIVPASSHSTRKSSFSKKARRSPSPKFEKRTRRNSKTIIEKASNNKRVASATTHKNDNSTTKVTKKRTPLKIKEGKVSPPPALSKQSKQNNNPPKSNNTVKLSQRRVNSANDARATSPVKRVSKSVVSTSLTVLPTSSASVPSSSSSESPSLDRVSRAMQSLSMGKLYTVDGGFIFPPHHTKELHLPDLQQHSQISKSEDFEISVSLSPSHIASSTQRRPSTELGSPRRSFQESSSTPHQTPPQSANRKRRYYAWQMANGSIHNALHSTPSISQLWDNPGRVQSETVEKSSSNSR